MNASPPPIPSRAQTLKVLRLMGDFEPIMQLSGDADGYGSRWTLHGQEVQPAIVRYLIQAGFIADSGATELGVRKLTLTVAGNQFRESGKRWWASLNLLEKLKITVFG